LRNGLRDGLNRIALASDLDIQKITAPRYCAKDAATLIPQRAADIANTLHQAVFGYMYLRPNGLKQHILSERPSSVFGKNTQEIEGFRAQWNLSAVSIAQLAAPEIQRKSCEE
jgi:hypothetical protein